MGKKQPPLKLIEAIPRHIETPPKWFLAIAYGFIAFWAIAAVYVIASSFYRFFSL
jgi:hypothetical protein